MTIIEESVSRATAGKMPPEEIASRIASFASIWSMVAVAITACAAFAGIIALIYTRADNHNKDLVIARLAAETARGNEASAKANERAGQLELQAQHLRGENLKLANDLEKLRRPRWLAFSGAAFANALKDAPKMDVQIWHPPDDAEASSLLKLELVPALEEAGWNITEVLPFVPTSDFMPSNPLSVRVGLNDNPVELLVSTDIFWETVGLVWSKDDI